MSIQSKTADLLLHFDGGCSPNPGGVMTYGFHLEEADGHSVGDGYGRVDGHPTDERTNNTAEFHALLNGLAAVAVHAKTGHTVEVRGDSRLVINIALGLWNARKPHLAKLARDVRGVLENFRQGGITVSLVWVDRKHNRRADALAASAAK